MLRWVSRWILKDEKNKIPKCQGNSDQDVRINLTEDWRHTRGRTRIKPQGRRNRKDRLSYTDV